MWLLFGCRYAALCPPQGTGRRGLMPGRGREEAVPECANRDVYSGSPAPISVARDRVDRNRENSSACDEICNFL